MEIRINCDAYDAKIVGLLAIANVGFIPGTGDYYVNRITSLQKQGDVATKGMVVGRCTGNKIDNTREIQLFNPIWQWDGRPAYFFFVEEAEFLFIEDTEALKTPRSVYKCFKARDYSSRGFTFPHVELGYKDLCWDEQFKALGHWNRTDLYFGNADWYKNFMTNYMPLALPTAYPYKGDSYDPAPAYKFGVLNTIVGKTNIKADIEAYWAGDYVVQSVGICYSDTNALPDVDIDDKIVNLDTKEPFRFKWNYGSMTGDGIINNLTANTDYYLRPYMRLENGDVVYGNVKQVHTSITGKKPELILDIDAKKITNNSAFILARITDIGDSAITAHGIKIGDSVATMQDVEVDDTNYLPEENNYRFETQLTGLTANTRIYVQIYATNADGTTTVSDYIEYIVTADGKWETPVLNTSGYFNTKQAAGLATVYEKKAINVGETTATLGGGIVSTGGLPVTEHGFVFSKVKILPTLDDDKKPIAGAPSSEFSATITGLTAAAKYFFRSYVKTAKGVAYSPGSSSFFTGGVALETNAITSITNNTAFTGGLISSSAGQVVTERGVCYSLNVHPTTANSKITSGSGVGAFISTLAGLASGKTYYARTYAVTANNTYYGNEVSFTTLIDETVTPTVPIVTTLPISNLTHESAYSGYKIVNKGSSDITQAGVGWCAVNNPASLDSFDYYIDGGENNPVMVQGFEPEGNYFMIAFAINTSGIGFGNAIAFTVPAVPDADPFTVEADVVYDADNNNCTVIVAVEDGVITTAFGVQYSTDKSMTVMTKYKTETDNSINFSNEFALGANYLQAYAISATGVKCYSPVYSVNNPGIKIPPAAGTYLKFPTDPYIGMPHSYNGLNWVYEEEGWTKVLAQNAPQLASPRTLNNIEFDNLSFVRKTENLFDKNKITPNNYISGEYLIENSGFYTSDYMAVKPSTKYSRTFVFNKNYTIFDKNKYVIVSGQVGEQITTPDNAAFIRLCMRYSECPPEFYMFIEGGVLPAEYKPFYENIGDVFNIEDIISRKKSRWFNKIFSFLGDSITWGFTPRNHQITNGTVSFVPESTMVTGVGTKFTQDMVGYTIVVDGDVRTVDTVNSETSINVDVAFTTTVNNSVYTMQYNDYGERLETYAHLLPKYLSCKVLINALSGTSLARKDAQNSTNCFIDRISGISPDSDVVVVMGGTNDIRIGIPLGTMNDRTDYTFYGALHAICQTLIDKFLTDADVLVNGIDKTIVLMTPLKNGIEYGKLYYGSDDPTHVNGKTFQDFAKAVKDVAQYYSLPCFDMQNESGINPHISRTIQGWQEGYEDLYNPLITDGTHPTKLGHEKIAKRLAQWFIGL